jgi:hypothetical protein
METLEKKGVEYTYNNIKLGEKIGETINKIKQWIEHNNYQVKGNIDVYSDLTEKLIVKDLSMNQLKKINKYIFYLDKKMSLKRVNSFFTLLSRQLGVEKVHVKESLKEETIQGLRKKMKIAKETYEVSLKAYKDEKGDFYKTR